MQSPEVIQFLQSMQATVHEKNKALPRSTFLNQSQATRPNTDHSVTSQNHIEKSATPSVIGGHGGGSVHGSVPVAGGRAFRVEQHDGCSYLNVDLETSEAANDSVSSTHQNAASQGALLMNCSQPITPLMADVQFVSVSAVIPGTVQYVLQQDLHSVTTTPKASSTVSPSRNSARGYDPPMYSGKQTHKPHSGDMSTKPVQSSQHSTLPQSQPAINPPQNTNSQPQILGSSTSLNVCTSVQMPHNPHLFSTASDQIKSSRHHLITQWLNANLNTEDVDLENDELIDDSTEQ